MLAEWFQQLYDKTGWNFTIFYDAFEQERFLSGLWMTCKLSLICIALSLIIGVVGAAFQQSKNKVIRNIVQGYVQIFRNTPPLVQMYFFFFGLAVLLPKVPNEYGFEEPLFSAFTWAVVSLSLFAGAFNVEIFRSGIEAVPHSLVEASEALGLNKLQVYLYVVLPLAFRVCLPALNNNLVNLVKTTTLAYAIGVAELLYVSNQIWSDNVNVTEMMIVLMICYFVLVGIVVFVMNRLEEKLALPGYGH